VLLEGGATLGSAFLRAGLVQRVVLYTAPLVLGGGLAWSGGVDRALAGAPRGRVTSLEQLGADARLVVELED